MCIVMDGSQDTAELVDLVGVMENSVTIAGIVEGGESSHSYGIELNLTECK